MTDVQTTLVQIDNYGPWTVTPAPRPEADLQTLQSRLYADLSQLVGSHGGYVFFTRFDNMVAVTNGMDRAAHRRVQESVGNRYPVTVSLGVGVDPSPRAALAAATEAVQAAGSAQDESRTEVLQGDPRSADGAGSGDVRIAHFDVDDATGNYTDELDAFDAFRRIERGYLALVDHMYETHGSLSFFVGGDNVISVDPELDARAYRRAVEAVSGSADVELKVGVGEGATAREAGSAAKEALEHCREEGTAVETALHGRPGGH